jgi:hypothetical protein
VTHTNVVQVVAAVHPVIKILVIIVHAKPMPVETVHVKTTAALTLLIVVLLGMSFIIEKGIKIIKIRKYETVKKSSKNRYLKRRRINDD